jgi:hypothetical protein
MAIGNEQFKQEIEALTGRKMKDTIMGAQPTHPQKKAKLTGV